MFKGRNKYSNTHHKAEDNISLDSGYCSIHTTSGLDTSCEVNEEEEAPSLEEQDPAITKPSSSSQSTFSQPQRYLPCLVPLQELGPGETSDEDPLSSDRGVEAAHAPLLRLPVLDTCNPSSVVSADSECCSAESSDSSTESSAESAESSDSSTESSADSNKTNISVKICDGDDQNSHHEEGKSEEESNYDRWRRSLLEAPSASSDNVSSEEESCVYSDSSEYHHDVVEKPGIQTLLKFHNKSFQYTILLRISNGILYP